MNRRHKMPFIEVSDITMYYVIQGKGIPLFFIPDWGTKITTVSEQIADFAKKFRGVI